MKDLKDKEDELLLQEEDLLEDDSVEITLTPQTKPNPIPRKKLLPILVILFCEAFNSTAIFAYVGYMVYDFKIAEKKEDLGFYAGIVASCFFIAQLCSSFFWGKLSDRIGRRPVLLFGSAGTFLSCIGLGFSSKFWMAVVARSISGLLNGNIGVVKTYLGEITDHTNQTKAFGYIGFMWGLGGIAGSMLGGLLARPAVKYPEIFAADGIFGQYPYLMVNILSSLFILVGFVSSYLFLTENERKSSQVKLLELELHAVPEFRRVHSKSSLGNNVPSLQEEQDNSLLEAEEDQEDVSFKLFRRDMSVLLPQLKSSEPLSLFASSTTPNLLLEKEKSIFRDRSVIVTCFAYALLGFIYTVLDEVFPLWSMQEVDAGGLEFTTNSIGVANAIAGIFTVIIQMFIYHRLANRLGLIRSFRIGTLLSAPVFVAFPVANLVYIHLFDRSTALLWVYFVFLFALRQIGSQMAFSSVMNLISNSVDSRNMGAVNGLGQSLVAATRAIGPITGANLLSWSLTNGLLFPFNQFFVFILCGIGLIVCCLLTIHMDIRLNRPKASLAQEEPSELS